MLNIRPHHLLCLRWFVGNGYSEEFTKNIYEVLSKLNQNNSKFILTLENDNICSKCPNLNSSDICISDTKVSLMDSNVIEHFSLTPGSTYVYSDIYNKIENLLTADIIRDICGNCEWYSLNLCWK